PIKKIESMRKLFLIVLLSEVSCSFGQSKTGEANNCPDLVVLSRAFNGDMRCYFVFPIDGYRKSHDPAITFWSYESSFRSDRIMELPKGSRVNFILQNNDTLKLGVENDPIEEVLGSNNLGAGWYEFYNDIRITQDDVNKLATIPVVKIEVLDPALVSGAEIRE